MASKVAINGLGRIGRAALKLALEQPELELVAMNDIGRWRTRSFDGGCPTGAPAGRPRAAAGSVDERAHDPIGVLVEVDEGRVGAPQQPTDGHAAAGLPDQKRTELAARTGQLAGGVDAPVGQIHLIAGIELGG